MKKVVFVISILLIIITSIYFNVDKKLDTVNKPFIEDNYQDETTKLVEAKMKEMSLEDKIAQMIIMEYRDINNYDALFDIFQKYKPGGFILFNENMDTVSKTRELITKLKEYNDIPLIVGMDEEGGSVQRLKYLKETSVTNVPYMYNLGKTLDTELAYKTGKVIAEELRVIGVNVDFAPVIDIYSNKKNKVIGKRSFGDNQDTVSVMALALASGLEDNGVIPTYKHFPGHGDTSVDSHKALPIVYKSYEELKERELKPFSNAIINGAKLIMVGHIALPEVTKDNTPASLSKVLITDILKNDMNYNGLVITDAFNMSALTNNYTQEEIVVKAINAGVDLLLMPEDIEATIGYIKENISEERINESVRKILIFKYQYLSDYEMLDEEYLGSKEHKEIVTKIPN